VETGSEKGLEKGSEMVLGASCGGSFCLRCDSGLKGRFPIAQGAALGDGPPKKQRFRGLKGRNHAVCGFALRHRELVLTHLALLKPDLQAWRSL
jgi:hypothetical protein